MNQTMSKNKEARVNLSALTVGLNSPTEKAILKENISHTKISAIHKDVQNEKSVLKFFFTTNLIIIIPPTYYKS